MIATIDAGGDNTKYCDGKQLIKYPSAIGFNSLERNLVGSRRPYDFEWSYEGKTGFAGTLAVDESEYAESRRDDSKAHFDCQLRVLIALHQFGSGVEFNIVVGQPIDSHTDAEKKAIRHMLQKRHEVTVNGCKKTIIINRCEVAPEGAAAGLLAPGSGTVRIIDIGSGSVNFATLQDRSYNNKGSFTFTEGMQSKRNMDFESFARQIGTKATNRKWRKGDAVYLCGGGATDLLPYIKRDFFPYAQLIDKEPIFANVKAFYLLAEKIYGPK